MNNATNATYTNNITDTLIIACQNNDVKTLLSIIDNVVDLNVGLRNACYYGHLDCVKLLVQHGATNINNGIHYASYNSHIHVIKYLLSRDACPDLIQSELIPQLLNEGCFIDSFAAEHFINSRNQAQEITQNLINDLYLPYYDINITDIICDYISY